MRNLIIKNKRKLLCFLCIISLCMQFPVSVTAEVGKIWSDDSLCGLSFREIAGNGWRLCSYNSQKNTAGSLRIPYGYEAESINTGEKTFFTIRGIEDGVFGTKEDGKNHTFSEVEIQPSDEFTIGKAAFQGVQVKGTFTLTIRDSGAVKQIGESAFENAVIENKIVIGSLTECIIGANAFRNMKINGKIQLAGSIDTLGDYALSNLGSTGISLPKDIRNMGNGVFYNMKMTGATFPLSDSLESMGSRVFEGTGLKAIKLCEGNHLRNVAEDAFAGIEGTTIVIPSTVEVDTIISIINLYHLNKNQNLIIQIPADVPADSEVDRYLQQNGLTYQKGEQGEIVVPEPTAIPTETPEPTPMVTATAMPTVTPTVKPTATPTVTPTVKPEATPTVIPTVKPTATPTVTPTVKPEATPTVTPTVKPEATPTVTPTVKPEATPTVTPTVKPEATPTVTPTVKPSVPPVNTPSAIPSADPVPTSGATKKPVPTQAVAKTTAKPGTKVFHVKKLKYEIAGRNQATVTGAVRKSETIVTIPNTVTIQGRLYRVTKIKAKAFRSLKHLKTVKVGNYVKVIGAEAFAGCPRLTSIQFGTGLVSLGKKSLYQDKRLRVITFKGTKLKKIGKKTFSGISPKKVSIKVKKSKIKAYLKLIRKAK